MPLTATNGTVSSVRLNSTAGVITSADVSLSFTDSDGNTYTTLHSFALGAVQQGHLTTFQADVIAALQTATGLALSWA